jgi:hypothetical protein
MPVVPECMNMLSVSGMGSVRCHMRVSERASELAC